MEGGIRDSAAARSNGGSQHQQIENNGNGIGGSNNKVLQTFQRSFVQVQGILDQNRLLINEINQNHESRAPDNLGRNVGLIRELNNNIRRVVDLYADLSISFTKSIEVSALSADDAESAGTTTPRSSSADAKHGHKRIRPAAA